eukprot:scaffold105732_cov36-Phaeocystis_antarctica.AAC.1
MRSVSSRIQGCGIEWHELNNVPVPSGAVGFLYLSVFKVSATTGWLHFHPVTSVVRVQKTTPNRIPLRGRPAGREVRLRRPT